MKSTIFVKAGATALATLMLSLSAPVFAKGDIFVDDDSLAIKGYDPVSYFVSAEAQKGQEQFSLVHEGNTWMFASEENKQAFIENPSAYIPQYGGHCAFAAAKNSIAPVDPEIWTIRDDKLYLNYNESVRDDRWLPEVEANIAQSDANWPSLAIEVETY